MAGSLVSTAVPRSDPTLVGLAQTCDRLAAALSHNGNPHLLNGAGSVKTALKSLMLSQHGHAIRTLRPSLRPHCRVFPWMLVILSDGTVTTCYCDPFGHNELGSVYDNDIAEIWNTRIRDVVEGDLYRMPTCRTCIGSQFAPLVSDPDDHKRWRQRLAGYPDVLQIEIMGACNYACCNTRKIHENRDTKLDLDRVFENIRSFLPHIDLLNLFNYGEPLLHERFRDFVGQCRALSPTLKMKVSTNGMLLDEKIARCLIEQKVNWVTVSVHGGPGTENMLKYSKRGADYDRVLANVKRLIDLRSEANEELPEVRLKALLFNWNDTDELMDTLRRDGARVGADIVSWALDNGTGGLPRSSKRFTPTSPDWRQLQARGEAC